MHDHHLLYSFRRCPYAMRARLGLTSAGITVELREIVLRNKPDHMIELSPKATVPVLRVKTGKVIDESLDIALWALKQNDPDGLLSPKGSSLEEMLELIKENDGPFKHHLDRTKYGTRYEGENPQDHRQQASGFLLSPSGNISTRQCFFSRRRRPYSLASRRTRYEFRD